MPATPPLLAAPIDDDTRYTAEVRFGVVMYGGVSLAIYINGVTHELFEMACATPRLPIGSGAAGSTRDVYARLSWLTSNPRLRADYAKRLRDRDKLGAAAAGTDPWFAVSLTGAERSRLVVDVISGTSAGGINGVFLAKALANGESFDVLERMWLEQGDIGRLLHDAESYDGLGDRAPRQDAHPKSLLNSDRMYLKLLDALREMGPLPGTGNAPGQTHASSAPRGQSSERAEPRSLAIDGASPLVEQLDLFVTTTDIEGAPVALRLFDKLVVERRYKQSFHFQYPNGALDSTRDAQADGDFDAPQIPFLAFAARCTSSFPFAFEPMTLQALTGLRGDAHVEPAALRRWDPYFAALPQAEVDAGEHVWRAFGDGGYLDNKPFSYVAGTLAQRFASVPVERKVVYIEPSPERVDPDQRPGPDTAPDALTNAIDALTRIPSYEGIREDLQGLLQRNRRIERVEKIVQLGEQDLEADPDPFGRVEQRDGKVPRWDRMSFKDTVGYYGLAFLPYRRLRLYAVTDRLADLLAQRWGIDAASDLLYALRALVRVWRDGYFDEDGTAGKQTVNAFLDQFDLDYRVRRLGFLLRKVDATTRLFRERAPGRRGPANGDGGSESSDRLRATVTRHFDGADPTATPETSDTALATLRVLKGGLLQARRLLLREARDQGRASAAADVPADPSRPDAGRQVHGLLAVLMDESPARVDVPPDAAALTRVGLRRLDGRIVSVALPFGSLRGDSSRQTLQEGVVRRAELLFEAAKGVGDTVLIAVLFSAIESLRFKPADELPAATDALTPSGRVRALLGEPRLEPVATTGGATRVQVVVGRSHIDAAAGDAALDLLESDVGQRLRTLVGEYYLRFDSFDQMSFPLYYDTGTGEPATVEVVRISPLDATRLIDESRDPKRRRKLAGTALANFGAFLDARWRRNDVMWGRLDGVERLVATLLPGADADSHAIREELVDLAHGRILRTELARDGQLQLTALLCDALQEAGRATPEDAPKKRLHDLVGQLALGTSSQRDRLEGILIGLLGEAGLQEYVKETRENDPNPEPKALLRNLSRAVTVTGRLLDGISSRSDPQRGGVSRGIANALPRAVPRWIARAGLVLQGIVAVSLPGTFNQRWFAYGLNVLYAFEACALVIAFLFGGADARSLAATALVVTIALHFLSLVAGDVMREKKQWRRAGVYGLIVIAVLLAALGVAGLRHVGLMAQLCGPAPVDVTASRPWFCERFGPRADGR